MVGPDGNDAVILELLLAKQIARFYADDWQDLPVGTKRA